ncbi:hypothetical protein Vretimale_11801 [Volvox reticuliferus]|uniref:N-acetyltransferase domain-containing protein n=1 Tax=Volvox reticuliferus TaxID=1737510 RepID=A0A8J4FMH3_9CHLO|nr:hypothetical protein Vretifemale_11272 [Volvox reticuliferus]GIM07761.1 hypothetical protein Vretimale_11801 [Volvox reticuliferus]
MLLKTQAYKRSRLVAGIRDNVLGVHTALSGVQNVQRYHLLQSTVCKYEMANWTGESRRLHAHEGYYFRPATEADLPTIQRLVLVEKMNPLGLDPRRFTVACCMSIDAAAAADGSAGAPPAAAPVAGIVQVVPLSSSGAGEGAMKLQSLVVSPEHRRKGLGSALVRQRLSALRPGTPVWLTAVERGISFYHRLGFQMRKLQEVPRCVGAVGYVVRLVHIRA